MLPEGFDPNLSKEFGMTLICAFVQQLDGELLIDGGESGQGTRFTVLFS
jgi:two-component sensor histidine kinase